MKYRQIASGERYAIAALRRRGLSAREIAAELGRAHTTISREIRRNSCTDGAYRPFKASHRTDGDWAWGKCDLYPRWCMSRRWNSGNDAPISTTLIAASTAA